MNRDHTSHIGMGTAKEYFTRFVLDSVVLCNLSQGCVLGQRQDESCSQWWQSRKYQNIKMKSGRIEVEAALVLFGCSLARTTSAT